MQSCGVKRPHSNSDEDEVIQEDSPEYLLPVIDPYSSDDEKERITSINKQSQKIPIRRKCIFDEDIPNQSSDFYPSEVLFFWDLDYLPLPDEVDLSDMSVVNILKHIFKFIGDHKLDNEHRLVFNNLELDDVSWKNRSVEEIYNYHLTENKLFAWLVDHDNVSIKTMKEEDYLDIENRVVASIKDFDPFLVNHIREWCEMIVKLRDQSFKGYADCDVMRSLFVHIKCLYGLPSIRTNGETIYNLHYYIQPNVASDDSHIFKNRRTEVTVTPDSVLAEKSKRRAMNFNQKVGKVVVEVYTTKNERKISQGDSTTPANASSNDLVSNDNLIFVDTRDTVADNHANQCIDSKESRVSERSNVCQENHCSKPLRKVNAIQTNDYVKQATRYISKSVPEECRGFDIMKKMTAEHVLQLIGLATERWRQLTSIGTICGMFMKNEVIYFSTLVISSKTLMTCMTEGSFLAEQKLPSASVKFSNFKLDITKPNHRLALIIFLKEFLE